jgi:hypothetical protein
MRAQTCRDSLGDAAPRRSMTRGATFFRSSLSSIVLLVVEIHSETAQGNRKIFERRILLIETFLRVADSAKGCAGRVELSLVTANAGFVSGEFRCRRVIRSAMAD